jgi:uncharacterized protein (TIGR02600 family)
MMFIPPAAVPNNGTLARLPGTTKMNFTLNPTPKAPYPAVAAVDNGDWDNGIGWMPDGGFLNLPDQGALPTKVTGFGQTPYFNNSFDGGVTTTFTSPSRMMPSPGMFGSLPTGFQRGLNWQTLLFRRQPAHPGYAAANGGFASNPDYLMLDYFWMPVVEPYAVSEPLSTAGKINMNFQIVPFTYIERSTGLYAVLKHEKVISVPAADYNAVYKNNSVDPSLVLSPNNYRRDLRIPQTLAQFQQRFDNSDGTGLFAFRTPAEICDIHLLPDNATVDLSNKAALDASMASYWSTNSLTGDNCRERPYTTIYPRLTTKSNTYTVHFRAQALKQSPASVAGEWTEGKDIVGADFRGSAVIERYIDPNNPSIPDYAASPAASPTLDSFYRWRVRSREQFAP